MHANAMQYMHTCQRGVRNNTLTSQYYCIMSRVECECASYQGTYSTILYISSFVEAVVIHSSTTYVPYSVS